MNDNYWQALFEMPCPEWERWSDKLSEEAQREQDDEWERRLNETNDLDLPPF